ncbi:MAG: hypothetical protein JW874_05295 [Spirochaetales bacterium]|nr:hypothetical protein [Spirochaetales bacterium]
MKRNILFCFFCIFLIFLTAPLFSQTVVESGTDDNKTETELANNNEENTSPEKTPIPGKKPEDDDHKPEEYSDDEFPVWLRDLRRGEIIAIGSFPFTFFVSQLAYGFYRYYDHDFDANYSPSFLMGSGSTAAYTDDEKRKIIVISLCLSAGMALVDFIIGKLKHDKKPGRSRR